MSDHNGITEGEICNREGCLGVMRKADTDTSCSCHINPPCSHCVNMVYECEVCGLVTDTPEATEPCAKTSLNLPIYTKRSVSERFDELPDGVFGYIEIPGDYYWMEYKGKYPDGMTTKEIVDKFNTCFGYKWIFSPQNGWFHIKVYTD